MIDTFTPDEFEAALPVHKETKQPLWKSEGLIDGEYAYSLSINSDIIIQIRSSIHPNGYSAEVGKDSIRVWLADKDGQPLGSKTGKWVTRSVGWQERMINSLRELWERARKAGYCSKCKVPMGVYKVKKQGPNKGRLFKQCPKCENSFAWLE